MIFITYFSLDRYTGLHFANMKKYVDNYAKLEKTNGRTVISFYTTPAKMKKSKPMVKSILDQTVKVDQIALNLPPSKEPYEIPYEYKDIINVYNVGKDYGPGTKIIPTLLREKDKGTKIIYLDDDKVYGKDFIEKMIEEGEKYPECAIINMKNNKICAVLVKPEFFTTDVIDNKVEYFDNNWFMKHLVGKNKQLKYFENYKVI